MNHLLCTVALSLPGHSTTLACRWLYDSLKVTCYIIVSYFNINSVICCVCVCTHLWAYKCHFVIQPCTFPTLHFQPCIVVLGLLCDFAFKSKSIIQAPISTSKRAVDAPVSLSQKLFKPEHSEQWEIRGYGSQGLLWNTFTSLFEALATFNMNIQH